MPWHVPTEKKRPVKKKSQSRKAQLNDDQVNDEDRSITKEQTPPASLTSSQTRTQSKAKSGNHSRSLAISRSTTLKNIPGAVQKSMPTVVHPMLATSIEKPFDNPEWFFEIKWDGYRAVTFIDDGRTRLVSRNQNDLSHEFPELAALSNSVKARRAILDGEIVALDDQGRPSFSLMQQRTGFRPGKGRGMRRQGLPIVYYCFDLLYLDDFDLHRATLENRKQLLERHITPGDLLRFSDHYPEHGLALYNAAAEKGLEGIVAKKRSSCYEETRSHDWLKIKITQRQECVIGGYTDPEGSRTYFGSLVLGLYDKQGRLIHVGQAGTGFDHKTLKDVFTQLHAFATNKNPFYGEIGGLRNVHFVRPDLVAEIKFSEWTHETPEGGQKLRAPVFMGLRFDKSPQECTLADALPK
jgi:bifunctional non-homologous end joining protein LigD